LKVLSSTTLKKYIFPLLLKYTTLISHLLSKNIKIRIYKTIVLPVVLHGCETWSLDIKGGTWTEGV
jgi:hypothetical protein